MTAAERETLMKRLMIPSADKDSCRGMADGLGLECPQMSDLIGFVTSGGYNLAAGRGTAVGALWVQRVTEGWHFFKEMHSPLGKAAGEAAAGRGGGGGGGGIKSQPAKNLERQRRLCIVRNAGESVGRLALWEVI